MNEIEQKLEQLHLVEIEYDCVEFNLRNEREGRIYDLLGEELFAQLEAINSDYDALLSQAAEQRQTAVNALQDEIKAATVQHGATVKAAHYMAVYSQPKPAWDKMFSMCSRISLATSILITAHKNALASTKVK